MIGSVVIEKKEKIGQPKFLLAATYSLFSSAFFSLPAGAECVCTCVYHFTNNTK